jgi:phosphatidylserine/phosphatidylglycerophosphate/cardiolipin synthase-like enzyme
MTHQSLRRLPILCSVIAILTTLTASAAMPPIYFTANLTPQPDPAAVTPLERALLDQITAATSTIDAALYEFDRPSLRDAFLAAHARGVRVRIVTDDETHYAEEGWPIYQALEKAGIRVVNDYGLGGELRVHDKYLILDGQRVWTGSTNLTTADLTRNHNDALLLTSIAVSQMFQHDFDQLFARRFGAAKTASTSTRTTHNGWPLEVYFSPQDAALDRIVAAVNTAQVSVDFAILQLKDDAVRDALLAAQERGVRLRGLLDGGSADDPYSDDEALCAAGAALKIEGSRGRLHHKFMLIDAGAQGEQLVAGSLNWTEAGRTHSSENTLVLHDPATVGAYAQAFERLWALLPPQSQCNVPPPSDWLFLPVVPS